jgi:hypothetical protein
MQEARTERHRQDHQQAEAGREHHGGPLDPGRAHILGQQRDVHGGQGLVPKAFLGWLQPLHHR